LTKEFLYLDVADDGHPVHLAAFAGEEDDECGHKLRRIFVTGRIRNRTC